MTLPSPTLRRDAITVAASRQCSIIQAMAELTEQPHDNYLRGLASELRFGLLEGEPLQAMTPDFERITYTEAVEKRCIAWEEESGWQIACVDPFDSNLRAWLALRMRSAFFLHLIDDNLLGLKLDALGDSQRALRIDTAVPGAHRGDDVENISLKSLATETSPAVRLLSSTLFDALKSDASDIHIESTGHGILLRYRIDGVLVKAGEIEGIELAEQLISRLKVLAELDIAERRVPQDGRFKARIENRAVDFRVSIMPSHHGEDAVLRILDKSNLDKNTSLSLTSLGFDATDRETMIKLASQPYGMLLVTGPTGSGKTTTLYSLINSIDHTGEKIITIEDPIEYQLPGALQIPVNDKKGLTFARGLRSILRHDPDRILVGEIRDAETAQIAVQSALTGHAVYTSVHANNVFDVIGRFMHMGIEAYSFVSALNGIVAQRLIRLNCPQCSKPVDPDDEARQTLGVVNASLRKGSGCAYCRGTGYKGRKAIAEILVFDDALRQMVSEQRPITELKKAAMEKGMRNLRMAALDCVREGLSTLEEINRVTFVD